MTSLAIAPLPPEVVAQIKSSVSITSVNGVIIQLLKNSLDAAARKIDVQVDYSRGSCIVEDDGLGIGPAEFQENGGLAKLHHTSKHASNTEMHGSQGIFLASLSALSLLSITSHHHLHRSHNSLALSRSQVISRQTPAPESQHLASLNYGTRVTVRNLFGDMPVRIKQRAIESADPSRNLRDWDSLRKDATALVLSWHNPVSVTVRELASGAKPRTCRIATRSRNINDDGALISHICSTLSQASFIPSPDTSSWVSASGSTSAVSIRGGISLDPAPTKGIQFMSFGIHPLGNEDGRNVLFEEVNRLFTNSSFGKVDELPLLDETEKKRRAEDRRYKSDGFTNKELRGSGKGVDRWPMFYMKIDIHDSRLNHGLAEDVLDDERMLLSVTKLLQAVIVEFLRSNNFTSKFIRRSVSPSKRKAETIEAELVETGLPGSFAKESSDMTGTRPQSPNLISRTADAAESSPRKRVATTLPARHSSPRPSSPFDVWPRVKSGRVPALVRTSKTEIFNVDGYVQGAGEALRPKNASGESVGEESGKDSASRMQISSSRGSTPLVSKSGIVSQLPFADVTKPTRRPTIAREGDVPPNEPSPELEKDELVSWTDPSTKESCLVNMRTGLVQQHPRSQVDSSTSSSEPRRGIRTLRRTYSPTGRDLHKPTQEPSPWLKSLLTSWNNPVFPPAETPIPHLPDHADAQVQSHLHSCAHSFPIGAAGATTGRLSKAGLRRAKVIAQVDRKFILARMPAVSASASAKRSEGRDEEEADRFGEDMLVIIDQHAADERCRIEALMSDFCRPPSPESLRGTDTNTVVPGVRTERLEKNVAFEVASAETRKLELHKQHFADWGVLFDVRPVSGAGKGIQKVVLTALPAGIAERCRTDVKAAIEMVRREVWEVNERRGGAGSKVKNSLDDNDCDDGVEMETQTQTPDWVSKMQGCPSGILELLNSRACRGAVMFNDVLTVGECEALVRRLAECRFPFMCAHGRMGMVPVVGVGWEERLSGEGGGRRGGGGELSDRGSGGESEFGRAFKIWKEGGGL